MPQHVIEWEIPEKDKNSAALINRNEFARSRSSLPVPDITLAYTHFLPWQLSRMLQHTLKNYRGRIKGTAIELGAGTGLLSTQLVNNFSNIHKVYALEYVDDVVRLIQPRVISRFCNIPEKILPTVGSFDHIQLPEGSVDIIYQIESLHHSNDLKTTFTELARVLKPGGIIISYDRVHADTVTDDMVNKMLDVVYTQDFKRKYGYPEQGVLTRRMNGEHEYRLYEWQDAIKSSGLHLLEMTTIARGGDKISNSLKRLLNIPHEKTPRVNPNPVEELKLGIKNLVRQQLYTPKTLTFFVVEKL